MLSRLLLPWPPLSGEEAAAGVDGCGLPSDAGLPPRLAWGTVGTHPVLQDFCSRCRAQLQEGCGFPREDVNPCPLPRACPVCSHCGDARDHCLHEVRPRLSPETCAACPVPCALSGGQTSRGGPGELGGAQCCDLWSGQQLTKCCRKGQGTRTLCSVHEDSVNEHPLLSSASFSEQPSSLKEQSRGESLRRCHSTRLNLEGFRTMTGGT